MVDRVSLQEEAGMGRAIRTWIPVTACTFAVVLALPAKTVRAQTASGSALSSLSQPPVQPSGAGQGGDKKFAVNLNDVDQAPGMIKGVGGMTSATDKPVTSGSGADPDIIVPAHETYVSFIDSSVPITQVRLLFDANYDDRRPTRAEYYFPKSGIPGSPGWLLPERQVSWQQLTGYFEFAYQNVFSGFIEVPGKWINPDVNDNNYGLGDINFGFKATLMQANGLNTAFQLRATIPTRAGSGLSSDHYSIEPGLLFLFQPISWLTFEGETRYWASLGGSDFAGDFLRYGLGVSFLQRSYDDFWFTPVVEFIGWSILSGKEMVPLPDGYGVRNSAGEEIVNAMAGVRFGFGDNGDIYTGIGHSLTGDAWMEWFWRVEFRVRF
jgi:hypothetical protein